MQPLVSIIIPVYNVEKYLTRCFDSITEQTYRNFEALIVNDGSSDNSLAICNAYEQRDNRFKVYSQENQGVSAARNLALEKVSSNYVCFVDADDYVSPIYIETLLNNMLSSDADISICGFTVTGEVQKSGSGGVKIWSREEAVGQWFRYGSIAGRVWGELYQWDKVSDLRFDTNYRLGEDQIFFLEAVKRSTRIVFQDIKLYFYYERTDSAMHREFDERYWDCVRMAERFRKEGEEHFPNQKNLFYKKEILVYLVLVINGFKYRNRECGRIMAAVLPRIRQSNSRQILKYCSGYEMLKYCMIKYIPGLTGGVIWIKERLKAGGR